MEEINICPSCNSPYGYELNNKFVCPECSFEWDKIEVSNNSELLVKDSNGNILNNGDTVSVIKDLPVKGSSSSIKVGTKVKNIKLVEGDHNISCKIDGFGSMGLKSEFVKKV